MKNNQSINNKFKGRTDPIGKRALKKLINNYNINNNNKFRQKRTEDIMPRIKTNQYSKDKYNFLSNQNKSQEINYNKKYISNSNNKSSIIIKSNSSGNIKKSNSNKSIEIKKKISSRINQINNNNIIDVNNNSYNFNKKNNYINKNINNKIKELKNKFEEKPFKLYNSIDKSQKINNNILFQNNKLNKSPSNNIIKNKIINKDNYFLSNKNLINNNKDFKDKNKIKLPLIISSPSSKNKKKAKNYERIKTFTPYFNNQGKIQNRYQNDISKNRKEILKNSAVRRLNNSKEKGNTFQNESIGKKMKYIKNNINSSNTNILKKINTNKNGNIKNIKHNLLNQNSKNKIIKSQSFVSLTNINKDSKNHILLANSNNNKEKFDSNAKIKIKSYNKNKKKEKIKNNPFYNDFDNNKDMMANIYHMNNIKNSYENKYNILDFHDNSNNNNYMNNYNNNKNKKSRLFDKNKINNITIKDYINNFDINQRNNNSNINNYHSIQEDNRAITSFDTPPLLLPNIQSGVEYDKQNMNNNYIDENNDNIIEILMNQRLNYQNKIPNNSRFKIKLKKVNNFY